MTQPQTATRRTNPKPLPQVIAAKRMRIAWMRGEVVPLSPQLDHCVQYLGHWWVNDDTEWIRVTAPNAIALLDKQKASSMALYRDLHAKHAA
ncbi:hypothetical protein [Glycomyces salinus]|uniref:hypothetical protein n=1 Tax=Glycomyces salinus TaxID=980294 RepID=UPI0018EB2CE5|nr:hypothetical protein [Glycomyces salinus]